MTPDSWDMERLVPSRELRKAVEVLRKGGIVAYPTDTLYGLGACIGNSEAVERIFQIKGRSPGMALPILVSSLEQMWELVTDVPPVAQRIAERLWPGPLTLVLPRSPSVPDAVVGGAPTVAVRWPAHPVPIALIKGAGSPITGTSANLSGRPPAHTASEVVKQLGKRIDFVVRQGPPPGGLGSTILEVTGGYVKMLREGPITLEDVEMACGLSKAQIGSA